MVTEFRRTDKYTIKRTNALELVLNQFELGTDNTVVSLWDNCLSVNELETRKVTKSGRKFRF